MRMCEEKETWIDIGNKERIAGYVAAFLGSLLIAYLSSGRTYFTFSTETDYIARNLAEAQRFLRGEPLLLQFHPPLYSIVLALMDGIFRDWFTTGLFVSWLSSTIVLVTSFGFFYRLGDRYAAWGSLVGLMSSQLFLTYSSYATQDMFFLAIYSSCFLLALLAAQKQSRVLWGATGLMVGCALLTRANALSLLVLLTFPWFQTRKGHERAKDFGAIVAASVVPLAMWGGVAAMTGAPLSPRFGHLNLAMRYFPGEGDPFTVEARKELMARFGSYRDVLLHDPAHMAATYLKDCVHYIKTNFLSQELLIFPISLFSLPGLFLLFLHPKNRFPGLFLLATVLQVALLGFKEYESRFYLFLVPVLAAAAGTCFHHVWREIPNGWKRWAFVVVFLPLVVSGVKETRDSLAGTYEDLHAQDVELGEAIAVLRAKVESNCILVSRKEHLPFYLQVRHAKFPDVKDLKEFRVWLDELPQKAPIYIYYGSDERRSRRRLNILEFAEKVPEWLKPVAGGGSKRAWILYRYQPQT